MTMFCDERSSRSNKFRPKGGAGYCCRLDGFLFNNERSRLEKIIFGMHMYDDNFMADVRYLWSDCLLMGQKIIRKLHTNNWLYISKKWIFCLILWANIFRHSEA